MRLLGRYCSSGRHTEAFPRRRRRSPDSAHTSGTAPPCYVTPTRSSHREQTSTPLHVGAGPVGLDGNIPSVGAFGFPYGSSVLAVLHHTPERSGEEACCVWKPRPVRGLLFGNPLVVQRQISRCSTCGWRRPLAADPFSTFCPAVT